MIKLRDINKKYQDHWVLKGVNLHINEGEVFGLLGQNGAGKSTLLSILATVTKPDSGEVIINNRDILKNAAVIRPWIGYVPQEIALYPTLSVLENLQFWGGVAPRKVTKEKIFEIAEVVNLKDALQTKVVNLSGGMRRKLNLAVAVLHDPKILIMDEPTAGIDRESKLEILAFLKAQSTSGVTIVYTTHDSEEIEYLCDRVGVLKDGVLL